jgi:hypothetical protein
MKALAARTRDIDDLRLLADIIGVDSAETALQICAEFFPGEEVPPPDCRRSPGTLQLTALVASAGTSPPPVRD